MWGILKISVGTYLIFNILYNLNQIPPAEVIFTVAKFTLISIRIKIMTNIINAI